MKRLLLLILLTITTHLLFAQQRVVAECTIVYGISVDDNEADKDAIASLKASSKTVYIKGVNSRTDLVSPNFTQSVIYQKNTGSAVILREFGANKFMTKLDHDRWVEENKKYADLRLEKIEESKTILGYECKRANLIMPNGSIFTVYYAATIAPSVKEFEYQFKDVPGLVLEYETVEMEGKKIRYTAKQINFNPVTPSRFDIPTSGYRLLQ